MLQILAFALNTVRCVIQVDLDGFPDTRINDTDNNREIVYNDLLNSLEKKENYDVVNTIFGYIPTQDILVNMQTENNSLNNTLEIDSNISQVMLRSASAKLKKPEPEFESLALETLIAYFYDFLNKSSESSACTKPEFALAKKESLNIPAAKIINYLVNNRRSRNIFEIFLKALDVKLQKIAPGFKPDVKFEKLHIVYAFYMRELTNKLLTMITRERRFFGDNPKEQFEQYYVFVPKSNVNKGQASLIFDATTWINTEAIEK